MSNRWERQKMTYIKLWLKGMQSNKTWFQYMYFQLVDKQNSIQQLIWCYPNRRKLQRLKYVIIAKLKFAEEIRECRKVIDFLISSFLENAKFEENRTPFLYLVINETNQWGLVFAFKNYMVHLILRMFTWATFNSVFDFMNLCSGRSPLVIHRQLTFRGSLHLEESSCSSCMKICSRNHTAVK